MYLAIITDVFEADEHGIQKMNAIPIKTGMLDQEILSRVPGILTRKAAKFLLEKALKALEYDTKMQTVYISTKHG